MSEQYPTLDELRTCGDKIAEAKVVALLDDRPLVRELIDKAYQLGTEVADRRHLERVLETNAINIGLKEALAAKNETKITVNTDYVKLYLISVVTIFSITGLAIFLYFHLHA